MAYKGGQNWSWNGSYWKSVGRTDNIYAGENFTITPTDSGYVFSATGGGSIDTSSIVYKAGTQTITGDKTFAGDVIISASAGAGKILTSDAGGNATWQANPHNSLTGVTADASVGVGNGNGYTPYQFGLRYFESPFDDFTYNAIDIYKDPVDSSGEIAFHFPGAVPNVTTKVGFKGIKKYNSNHYAVPPNLLSNDQTLAVAFNGVGTDSYGMIMPGIISITSGYTALATDYTISCNGTFTVTIPSGMTPGKFITIKNMGTGAITVARSGSDTFDGATSYSLPSQYKYVTLQYAGTSAWLVIGNN